MTADKEVTKIDLTPCSCGRIPRITHEGNGEWAVWCEGFHATEAIANSRKAAIELWEEQWKISE